MTGPTLEDLERDVKDSRHVDKRQKWILFGLVMALLVSLGIIAGMLVHSFAEVDDSNRVAASEQQEKKEIAEVAEQAICQSGDTEIYDEALCEQLQAVADEPLRGEAGPEGPQGPRGQDGLDGTDGADGTPGPVGPRGPQGEIGPGGKDGADGAAGLNGLIGAAGGNGLNGADGLPGPPGPPGADGAPGPPGAAGPQGPAGADGSPGTSGAQGVSIVDVDCIGSGSESSWQITLSDGQILNGGGPCQVATTPDPSPTTGGP